MKETALSRSIRLVFSGCTALGLQVLIQPASAQETDTQIQRVEITGSSIKRAQVEGALPVQTVTREDIQKLGVTSVEQLLSTLTATNMVGGTNVAQGAGSPTYGISAVSLRGLGSQRTLVLVNGRRLANYATDGTSVDINSLPLSLIDRIEVLKDGASGVYGSDAIAGVINFILRKNFVGTEVNGYAGTTKDGGGTNLKAGLVVGFGDYDKDRYNLLLSLDVGKDKAIYGSQRNYANRAWDNGGWFDQSATPSGALRTFRPATTPNSQGIIPNALRSQGSSIGNPLSPDNCTQNGSEYDPNFDTCRYNSSPLVPLVPEVRRASLSANFRFKLNDDNEFFIEGFNTKQITRTSEQPSPYSVSFLATDSAFATQNIYPAIILSPTSPYYPANYIAANSPSDAGNPVTVSYRAFDGGGRIHEDDAVQAHLVAGFRGAIKNYDYDFAYVHNSSRVSESTQQGYQLQTALVSLLSNNPQFNPFTQYQTPSLAAQIYGTNYNGPIIDATLTTDALEGKISGDLFKMPAGTASFAAGAVIRNENLSLNPSLAYMSGDVAGYGVSVLPFTVSRHSDSIFGEVNVPIAKGLEANLAVRTDRYQDTSSTNPKLSLRYQPASHLLFRAAYGTGFREASLPELYTPRALATTQTFTDPVTGKGGQWTQLTGGTPTLSPEKSNQASIGLVFDPVKDASISLDYWRIRVRNAITTLGAQAIVEGEAQGNPLYAGLVQRDMDGNITQITNVNINAGSISTAGIDLDFRWLFARTANYGNFGVHLNGTYLTKYDETLPDGTVQPSIARTIDENGNVLAAVANGGIIFRWKHILTFDWKRGPYAVSLTQNFQSGYWDAARADSATGTDAQHIGAFSTWDIQAAYNGIKNLTLRAGLKNMFNRKPLVTITAGNYFQVGYDPSWYDPHGMFGYITASYKF